MERHAVVNIERAGGAQHVAAMAVQAAKADVIVLAAFNAGWVNDEPRTPGIQAMELRSVHVSQRLPVSHR
jgi:hypothetical protein